MKTTQLGKWIGSLAVLATLAGGSSVFAMGKGQPSDLQFANCENVKSHSDWTFDSCEIRTTQYTNEVGYRHFRTTLLGSSQWGYVELCIGYGDASPELSRELDLKVLPELRTRGICPAAN